MVRLRRRVVSPGVLASLATVLLRPAAADVAGLLEAAAAGPVPALPEVRALSAPLGWHTASHTNCFSSDGTGYAGGEPVTSDTNPIGEPLMLSQCMERCEAIEACTAVLLQETGIPTKATCFLRKRLDMSKCMLNWPDFNMFLRPIDGESPKYGLEAALDQWVTHPSMKCDPGHGAKYAVPGQYVVGQRLDLTSCQKACINEATCEAIIWSGTAEKFEPNCYLRASVVMSECRTGMAQFDLMLLHRGGSSSSTGSTTTSGTTTGSSSSSSTTSGSTTEQTSTAGSTTSSETTTAEPSTTSSTATSPPTSTIAAEPLTSSGIPAAWATVAGTNCFHGMGSHSMSKPLLDPMPQRQSLKDCQDTCMSESACQGVVMSTDGGSSPNCWLRGSIVVADCPKAQHYDLWIKPKSGVAGTFDWYSLPGVKCGDGQGADDAAPGGGPIAASVEGGACEAECSKTAGCEAVMWYTPKDPDGTPTCNLRKNLNLSECVADPKASMRVMRAHLPEHVHPDHTEAVQNPADGPWQIRVASLCRGIDGGFGSIPGYGPAKGHKTLKECQSLCLGENCTAIMMKESKSGDNDNCWLRAGVDASSCEVDDLFNTWIMPVKGAAPVEGSSWYSFAGKTCFPDHGGDFAVDGQDAFPSHLSMKECQLKCVDTDGCEAVVWLDTRDAETPNCRLRKNIHVYECKDNADFDLRIHPSFINVAMAGGPPSGIGGAATSTATTPAPTGQFRQGWATQSATSCYTGHGAEALSEANLDPVSVHKLLKECISLCADRPECEGIVMRDTKSNSDNCWLRKNINLGACQKGPEVGDHTVWVKPNLPMVSPDMWRSIPGINCFPGQGGDFAVPGSDVLTQHMALADCEARCAETNGCEGIIWHDTLDSASFNCYLRKNIVVDQCRQEVAFNLRIRGQAIPDRLFMSPKDVRQSLPAKLDRSIAPWYTAAFLAAMLGVVGMSWKRARWTQDRAQRNLRPVSSEAQFEPIAADIADNLLVE